MALVHLMGMLTGSRNGFNNLQLPSYCQNIISEKGRLNIIHNDHMDRVTMSASETTGAILQVSLLEIIRTPHKSFNFERLNGHSSQRKKKLHNILCCDSDTENHLHLDIDRPMRPQCFHSPNM